MEIAQTELIQKGDALKEKLSKMNRRQRRERISKIKKIIKLNRRDLKKIPREIPEYARECFDSQDKEKIEGCLMRAYEEGFTVEELAKASREFQRLKVS